MAGPALLKRYDLQNKAKMTARHSISLGGDSNQEWPQNLFNPGTNPHNKWC